VVEAVVVHYYVTTINHEIRNANSDVDVSSLSWITIF
jgi:hypothetical protein